MPNVLAALRKLFKKHQLEIISLLIIFIVGAFLRTYHFQDWLHFELDQAYDLKTVSPAITNGISNLSLFGPNVGGGELRLGPAFYYLEYFAALIFGNNPAGHAMSVLLLNLAAIPLFYLFCRRYFSIPVSLGLDAIFSLSVYSVMYSRFSWSPNVLPFLTVLTFYSLLRSSDENERKKSHWFLIAVAAGTITSQIHLNSFFSTPLIMGAFVLIKRPKFTLKTWVAAFALIFLLYSPVIISDLKNNGQNARYLIKKFEKTAGRRSSMLVSTVQAIEYNAYANWFIISSNDQVGNLVLKDYGFSCAACRENISLKIFALILFVICFLCLFYKFHNEKNENKKNFLLLNLLWALTSLWLLYTIAKSYRMYPRFFLYFSPLSIVLFGMILQHLKPAISKVRFSIFILIIGIILSANIARIIPIFHQLQNAASDPYENVQDGDIFPETNRITYEQEKKVVDYIQSKYEQNKFPVFLSTGNNFAYPLWYLLEQKNIYYSGKPKTESGIYVQGNYFIIKLNGQRQIIDSDFETSEVKQIGSLIVYYVKPLAQFATPNQSADIRINSQLLPEDKVILNLLTWKKLF